MFRGKVHIGYLAAIVAASNAGGAGSVVGDTTTTMMWIAGVIPGRRVSRLTSRPPSRSSIFGIPASRQQHALFADREGRAERHRASTGRASASWRSSCVAAIATNVVVKPALHRVLPTAFPFIGVAVWVALIATAAGAHGPTGRCCRARSRGTRLPALARPVRVDDAGRASCRRASWPTAFGLGFVSAVFDNIPLTALALKQGGYDWGFLAYAVGFGGSMIWFGSSAGVALSNPCSGEAKSVGAWLRHGWHVAVALRHRFLRPAGGARLASRRAGTGAADRDFPARRLFNWL